MIPPLDSILLALMVACAVAALEGSDLLASVILFGVFSFLAAGFYAVVGAVDVSFTEAVLGAVIATVFFISAIHRSTGRVGPRRRLAPIRHLSWVALLAAAGVLAYAARTLPELGDPSAPASRHVSPRYIERGAAEAGAKNIVTTIIVDYRSFDTLGETVVIFTAGLACLLILPGIWPARRGEGR